MKVHIKYISPASLAAILSIFYFIIGCFIGLFGVIASLSGNQFTMSGPVSFSGSGAKMLPFAIAYPFLAALVGAIGGFIIAWIYNFVSRFTKGLLIETQEASRYED